MGFSKDKDAPPPYTEHLTRTSSHIPAPAYSSNTTLSPLAPPTINNDTLLPNSFKVGCREVVPFVTVPEMILHLRLLAAFDRLQHVVRTTSETAGDILDSDTRWSVFCTRAEKNFERWVEELGSTSAAQLDASNSWPALDVVMVWHSYVLNPRKFYEDTQRDMRIGRLGEIGFPLDRLTRFIDPVTLEYNPPRREKQSSASASLPFPTDPETSTFQLACPQCSTINHVPWLKSQGMHTGYCQKDFKHLCVGKSCGLIIKHETLRVLKVCQNLTALANDPEHFLPGLGLMPTTGELTGGHAEVVSWAIVQVFKLAYDQATIKPLTTSKGEKYGVNSKKEQQLIMQQLEQQPPFTASNLGKHVLEWKFEKFEKIMDDNLKSGTIARLSFGVPFRRIAIRLRISRMYAAYDHPGLASLALGPAVMRQANFIGKMKGMGWLEPGRFESDGPGGPFLLQKAAARYHAFLDLMTTMPSGFLCPTLDIDLAWHTHQLKTEQYRLDTIHVTAPIPRFVDHDDKVSETKLGDAYDLTSRAWLARFKVPYSQCGCHQGDLSAIDGGLAAAIPDKLKFWNKGKTESKTEKRRRAIERVIEGMEQGEKDASHPSVHNLISVDIRANQASKNMRIHKVKKLDRQADALHQTSAATDKDWHLKRALTKDPSHLDPFIQDLPTLKYTRNKAAISGGFEAPAVPGMSGKALPYWGVGVGGAMVIGGAMAWGLAMEDPHCMTEEHCHRGGCAAGIGAGGGGYCGTGGTGACELIRSPGCLCCQSKHAQLVCDVQARPEVPGAEGVLVGVALVPVGVEWVVAQEGHRAAEEEGEEGVAEGEEEGAAEKF